MVLHLLSLTSLWRQEYASYMVEGTPGNPYLGFMAQFNVVEANMKMRCVIFFVFCQLTLA